MQALLLLQAAPPAGDSYAADLLRSLLAVAGVCATAFFALRYLQRRGFGGVRGVGAVRVLQRVPLEPRKSLYLVRAGGRVLLIGTGDAGPPALLAELDAASVEAGLAPGTAPAGGGGAAPPAGGTGGG